jgi:TRAP-type C4-dicarboxylate transport system permease small subunit
MNEHPKNFYKTLGRIEGGMASVGAGVCLLAMIVITVISVVGRYVLQQDILPGAYNLIERVAFPLIVFWAMPMAHREATFPRFDTVVLALPPRLRRAVQVFVGLVELAVYAVVMWYVLRFTWKGILDDRTMQIGADFWPIWPVLVMMPLAFGLMMLEMLRLVWCGMRGERETPPSSANDNVSAAF